MVNRRRVVLLGGSATAAAMVVGITTNQLLSNGVWSWLWFAAALACAAATVVANRRMAAASQPHPILRRDLVDVKGHPLPAGQVTPRQLGVHPSRFGAHGGDSAYIERDVDEALARALRDGGRRLVVVAGPRLAGATSALARAARAYLADHHMLVFASDPRLTVAQLVAQARRWAAAGPGAVLWLDDLTPSQLGQLDRALLDDLPAGMWILATVHDKHLDSFRAPGHVALLPEEKAVRVAVGAISDQERDAVRGDEVYAVLRPVLDSGGELLMGRLMVAPDQIQDALISGRAEESADQVALVHAVTDWYRVAMPALLTRPALRALQAAYRRDAAGHDHDAPVSTASFERALTWATARATRARPKLVDLEEVCGGVRYSPHPMLAVVADDTGQPGAWPVGDALWTYADRLLSGDQRRDIGYAALDRGAYPHARRLIGHDDTPVEPAALHRIAEWLAQTGDVNAARRWYQKVVTTGHSDVAPAAMVNLGVLEDEQGNPGEARRWWAEAIATGHSGQAPKAMFNLGSLGRRQGNPGEARRWWADAAGTGHPDQAPKAMINLGNLEDEQGNPGEARRWWADAAGTGHPDQAPKAMVSLGNLERRQGNPGEARRWWAEAIATGHPDQAPKAMVDLGVLEEEQGSPGEARRWWAEAIATGHPDQRPKAMVDLGVLEDEQGNPGEARLRYGKAIATGHPDQAPKAMFNLGVLEDEQGSPGEARRWYGEVIATGHPDAAPGAMINLGVLEHAQGNLGEARRWYGRAIATGHPDQAPRAMVNLGVLEHAQGNPGVARRWYGRAVATGHPDQAPKAGRELRDLDRREEERRRRAEHSGRYGWQAHADPELMKPRGPGPGSPGGDRPDLGP